MSIGRAKNIYLTFWAGWDIIINMNQTIKHYKGFKKYLTGYEKKRKISVWFVILQILKGWIK
jgi:hypothetical protein